MASLEKYDRLEEPPATGDKDDLIDNESPVAGIPRSESSSSGGGHGDLAALKKKRIEMMEAGKAAMADQTRGLRIIVICAFIFSVVITIALIMSIYLGNPQDMKLIKTILDESFPIGANAAVAADISVCSDAGLKILKEGGNAVDAAVTAVFCMGVVNAESSGIGGGGFMLVHDHKNEVSNVYDFRETAPSQAKSDMYKDDMDDSRKTLGPLAIGIPGEVKGMEAAHQKYGKLSWERVVSPAVEIAQNGFHMTGHTATILKDPKFDLENFMKSNIAKFYTDADGNLKKENDLITRPDLAATLKLISDQGSDVFYKGSIAGDIIKEIVNSDNPGIMRLNDLKNYKVEVRDVVKTSFKKYTIESIPAPGSGPALLSIMNFLEGYPMKQDNISYHRILEAFKFAYAQREQLGDPAFNKEEIEKATNIMISKDEAVKLRNITTDKTNDAGFYGHAVALPNDAGTAQVSVIDTSELIVSITTSVNTWFGSMVMTDSGILLNNVMKDFSPPGNTLNEIQPGKRPLSSMVPTVVYETGHLCGLRMVLGGVNGTRIITGVAQVLLNNLTLGLDLQTSVNAPRIHSQLEDPDANVVEAEEGFSPAILDSLKKMGHVIQMTDKELNMVTAVLKVKDNIEAVSDARKGGARAAIFR